jgi:hypothetical protein
MHGMNYTKRRHSRWSIEGPISLAAPNEEDFVGARMRNISESGMYFECGRELELRADVCICLGGCSLKEHDKLRIYDYYRSRVCWRKTLETGDGLGVGVHHIAKRRGVSGPEFRCIMCEKNIPMGKVHFVKDFLYLCPECHAELERYSGACKEEVLRALEGNIF